MNFEDIVGAESWEDQGVDLGVNVMEPWAVPKSVTRADIAAAIVAEIESNETAHDDLDGTILTVDDCLMLRTTVADLAAMFHRVAVALSLAAS